jgi:hypothetical protein
VNNDATTIGLLVTAITGLAGLVGWLVRQIVVMMQGQTKIIENNTRAFMECTGTIRECLKAIERDTHVSQKQFDIIENYFMPRKRRKKPMEEQA